MEVDISNWHSYGIPALCLVDDSLTQQTQVLIPLDLITRLENREVITLTGLGRVEGFPFPTTNTEHCAYFHLMSWSALKMINHIDNWN